MADFYFTPSPLVVSADGNSWIDPPAGLPNPYYNPAIPIASPPNLANQQTIPIPSRQNATNGNPHRYNRFKIGSQINVQLNPLGTSGFILDTALGGRLFQAWFAEVPNGLFAWSSVNGASAYQFFTPIVLGSYCAVLWRDGGGGILWHFAVEP